MSELEWLITDKFTINSGGKTGQARRMESAARSFSSKMSPTTLNFSSVPPSPLKSIENYYGRDREDSMEVFQTLGKEELHCFQEMYQRQRQEASRKFSFGQECSLSGPSHVEDGLVPECSGSKMARLHRRMEDKENNFSLHPTLSSEVVRSPTRLDLSCLLSPSRRKLPQPDKLHMRPTPSKFTMMRNTLDKVGSPTPVSITKQVSDAVQMMLDYECQDSGFEMTNDKSVEHFGDFTREVLSQSSLDIGKFHDELTQSACHYDGEVAQKQQMSFYMEEQAGADKGHKSPVAHCSKQAQDLEGPPDCEYDVLQDLEDYDSADIALGSSMSKYEIISTDSPDIALAKITPLAVQRILSDHFQFGSPIGEEETSKDFSQGFQDKTRSPWTGRTETTRMLNFDTPTPPAANRSTSGITSLKDGSVFKLGIQQLSLSLGRRGRKVSGSVRMEHDSGLGSEGGLEEEEDTRLVLGELEGAEDTSGTSPQPHSLHSLIHSTLLHQTDSTKNRSDGALPPQSSPPHLSIRKPMFRRCFSLNQSSVGSNRENIDVGLCDSPKSVGCRGAGFKRPDTRLTLGNMSTKKRKYSTSSGRPQLHRAMSENQASINMALTSCLEETDLIGDFSRPYHLPVVTSQHTDLKVISPDTLASLLNGEHADAISSYQIIDCRYPYEYQGGHIKGAINLYSEELIYQSLMEGGGGSGLLEEGGKRHILVFHCEFSLQRGPRLVRYLRSVDRQYNNTLYPRLLYPELYLLQGGYCLFHNKFSTHTHGSYTTMLDPSHLHNRRRYQARGRRYL